MIISFIQTKGGTGKTTLATCLAYSKTFQKRFKAISLIELDPQDTIKSWHTLRQESKIKDHVNFISLAESSHDDIEQKLTHAAEENDAIIMDVPGESIGKFATKLAFSLSNIILIPMRSSTYDEQSFEDKLFPVIDQTKDVNPKSIIAIIPTFVHPQTKPDNVRNYFMEIMPKTIDCLKNYLPARGVYENFQRDGMTLYDYAESVKSNKKYFEQAERAINDIEGIAKEILILNRG